MVVCGIILIVSFRYCNKCTRNLTIQGKTQLCMKPPGFLVIRVTMHSSSPGPIASSIVSNNSLGCTWGFTSFFTSVVTSVEIILQTALDVLGWSSFTDPLCDSSPDIGTAFSSSIPSSMGCTMGEGSYHGAGTPSCLHSS